jgi:hypothetical protein
MDFFSLLEKNFVVAHQNKIYPKDKNLQNHGDEEL